MAMLEVVRASSRLTLGKKTAGELNPGRLLYDNTSCYNSDLKTYR